MEHEKELKELNDEKTKLDEEKVRSEKEKREKEAEIEHLLYEHKKDNEIRERQFFKELEEVKAEKQLLENMKDQMKAFEKERNLLDNQIEDLKREKSHERRKRL